MDFQHSARSLELQETLSAFLAEVIYPAVIEFHQQEQGNRHAGAPFSTPAIMADLKAEARRRGLWNLFLPDDRFGAGLSVLDYAPLAELSGRAPTLAPEAMNCSAPDTGNMELLAMFGSPAQHEQWLMPLLEGQNRSCFSMTEPDVASSDATNIDTRITRDGDCYVVNGRKWWSTGAMRPECKLAIVMGVSDPEAARHARHSMILVPLDTPGVTVQRSTTVFGYDDGPHGPGRIHHCMRSLGMAERALELMVHRALDRQAFGGPLANQGVIREWIAESRLAIEQARLLVLKAAWLIDTVGVKQAATEIAAIKVAAPRAASYVLDRAIQTYGAAGVSGDTPLAEMWAGLRTLHLADGPDEVHLRSVARVEIDRMRAAVPPALQR
jgi:acyl-CoA dehydrogenase